MRHGLGEEKARNILGRALRRAAIGAGMEFAARTEGGADLERRSRLFGPKTTR